MANRRMFSVRIANSARFLQMPSEAQLLYFHLIVRADDDGIVESYPITKLLGLAPDNFKILISKGFIRQLNEDQVVVILDWKEHNTIRADRKTDSIYLPLLKEVVPGVDYVEPKPRSDVKDNTRRLGGPSTDSISKVKLSKDKINTQSSASPTSPPKKEIKKSNRAILLQEETVNALATKFGFTKKEVAAEIEMMVDWCQSKGKVQKDYVAFARNWLRRKKKAMEEKGVVFKEDKEDYLN